MENNIVVEKRGLSSIAKVAIGAITAIVIIVGIIFSVLHKKEED